MAAEAGAGLLLAEACMACNREAGWHMCDLCRRLTLAEIEAERASKREHGHGHR